MLSGLGRSEWAPVHRFCEETRLPCLFPHTDLPGANEDATYSFYFSRGVLLEADLLAAHLAERAVKPQRLVQISVPGSAGAAAANALEKALAGGAVAVVNVDHAPKSSTLPRLESGDALVLWLDAAQVAALTKHARAPQQPVFVSGTLGGFERVPLPPSWRRRTYLLYPVEAAGRWELRARFNLRPWLARHGLRPGNERLQGNTLAACATFADAVSRSRGLLMRDYLVENVEAAASAMGNSGATAAFPRFLLGTNQRFASKGGYVVRFADQKGTGLTPVSDWIVP
jgi:hypothetical protein